MKPELGPPELEEVAFPDEDVSWRAEWEHFAGGPRRRRGADADRSPTLATRGRGSRRRMRAARTRQCAKSSSREPRPRHRRLAGNRARGCTGTRCAGNELVLCARGAKDLQQALDSLEGTATRPRVRRQRRRRVAARSPSNDLGGPRLRCGCDEAGRADRQVRACRVRPYARDQRGRHPARRTPLPAGSARGQRVDRDIQRRRSNGPAAALRRLRGLEGRGRAADREPRSRRLRPGRHDQLRRARVRRHTACTRRRSRPAPSAAGPDFYEQTRARSGAAGSRVRGRGARCLCFVGRGAVQREADLRTVGPVARYRVSRRLAGDADLATIRRIDDEMFVSWDAGRDGARPPPSEPLPVFDEGWLVDGRRRRFSATPSRRRQLVG